MTLIHDALATYEQTVRELDEFRAEWAPMLERFEALQEQVQLAKGDLLSTLSDAELDYAENGSFAVSVVRQDRGSYNVDKLPKTPAMWEYLDLSISRANLVKAIKRGVLTEAQAQAAWESKPIAPYLRITPFTLGERDHE